jgi:hypothetical protein
MSFINCSTENVLTSFVGDDPEKCSLVLFCDAGFAGDLNGSRSTGGGILCIVGPNTFCPISWLCKKQGAVSHSSAEAEIIAMDAAVRLEGLPALYLWDLVIDVFASKDYKASLDVAQGNLLADKTTCSDEIEILLNVDYVPSNVNVSIKRAKLFILEDNDAVIKMCIKGRSPNLRHCLRTHRIDLDWIFERLLQDPEHIAIKYINTKQQLADIFTKGSFSEQTWNTLTALLQLVPSAGRK